MAQRSQRGKRKDGSSTDTGSGMALSASGWSVALLTADVDVDNGAR